MELKTTDKQSIKSLLFLVSPNIIIVSDAACISVKETDYAYFFSPGLCTQDSRKVQVGGLLTVTRQLNYKGVLG